MSKIVIDRAVVERALKALERADRIAGHKNNWTETVAIRAALDQPQVEQEPFAVLVRKNSWHYDAWEVGPRGNLDYGKAWADERINVYTHPQNLRCKSNQHRLATLWGYEKPQPPRQPLTPEAVNDLWIKHARSGAYIHAFARAIERAHGIGGGA